VIIQLIITIDRFQLLFFIFHSLSEMLLISLHFNLQIAIMLYINVTCTCSLKLFSEKCVCMYMYVCMCVCLFPHKALEVKSSLYMRNEGYKEPVLNLYTGELWFKVALAIIGLC